MKVAIMVDSFKDSISSKDLGEFICNCLRKQHVQSRVFPISDGGEGFLDMLEEQLERVDVQASDGLKNIIDTYYLQEQETAYVEMAKCCGYVGLDKTNTSILERSTYALGEVIKKAIQNGSTHIVVGLGGSSTNDGGAGLLEALGFEFYDDADNLMKNINPKTLKHVKKVIPNHALHSIQFTIVCDVKNPLLGKSGATFTYGGQKGADEAELVLLEDALTHFASLKSANHFKDIPGSGAAGGVAYSFLAYLNAVKVFGIDFIKMKNPNLENNVDILITGEGKLDDTSLSGKVVFELIGYIKAKRNIVLCGMNELTEQYSGVEVYAITPKYATIKDSIKDPKPFVKMILDNLSFEK